MRFIDSNVFIHAYIKPTRRLQEHEERIKQGAKAIVRRVNRGEEVITTVVHLGEIANLLENFMPHRSALDTVKELLYKENIQVQEISKRDYIKAIPTAEEAAVGLNDALAYALMEQKEIREIYTFDKDFDRLEGVRRATT